ncbi:amidohydrolase family protein [Szabonella alba]|uniref:Amidohydrolase family protein n=1 Tax=Szabonella alba TaxID=2804194 RepID=A0A8K0V9S6_9RHOB|nr:amidohydrolase family protein [Szabonella alba]MBL4918097.1 amidohydrolase family protein [Szabonella alba]
MIDAHFHIWRQADLPWLMGPMQPRIFGPYEPIRRDYPVTEYLDDIAGLGVTKAVYVQANWPPDRAEAEVNWLEDTALASGWPMGIVGYADMTVPDARPALDRLARSPRLRGIRQQFHWHENPMYRFAAHSDLCRDPAVQRNIGHLADYGWSFDLQVFAGQLAGACDLLDACPRVNFILQHAGMLEDTSAKGRADWQAAMTDYARRPNAFCKLSGFGTFIHRNDPAHIRWLVETCVGIFGAERCLWGSNFPIEKLWTSYSALLGAHRDAAASLTEAQRRAIFTDTASRVYRL